MLLLALLLLPTLTGMAAFVIRADGARRILLLLTALVHAGLMAMTWITPPAPILGGLLGLDAAGRLFLMLTSLLFLAITVYGMPYLRREAHTTHTDFEEDFLFVDAPEARFTGCLLLFLAAMTLVT